MTMRWWVVSLVLVSACAGSNSDTAGGGKDAAAAGLGGGSAGNGGAGSGSKSGDGFGDSCSADGETRSCCGTGHQVCGGGEELRTYGHCLDASGKQITCAGKDVPGECGTEEFSESCDAGVDSGVPERRVCGDGEFGESCVGDGGLPPMPKLCTDKEVNNEPEILAGYTPEAGKSVGPNGQITVWITDEWPTVIAPNEQVDGTTGEITMPGDRTAKAADGYLMEPALYIAPLTVENGGAPHFPQYIKGWYNNGAPAGGGGKMKGIPATAVPGAPMDPAPANVSLSEKYSTEVIWDVSELGLSPGTYMAEFVVPDGDNDRAIGCVTITITK